MNYSVIYHRYHVLGGTSLKYWGNRCQIPRNRLPVKPQPISILNWKNPKASLVGEKCRNVKARWVILVEESKYHDTVPNWLRKTPQIQISNISGSWKYVRNWFGSFPRFCWGILLSQEISNIGFGAQGHVQKFQNHRNDEFSVFPISKSKSYYSKG